MNIVRNIGYWCLRFALLFCVGCVEIIDPIDYEKVSISFLESEYYRHPRPVIWPWRIQGTVTSSDEFGNFYKCLMIEDETAAIELRLDQERLYEKYPLGSRVEVMVSFMWLDVYGYNAVLGAEPDERDFLTHIPYRNVDKTILIIARDSTKEPAPKEIGTLKQADNQLWVIFDSVQFIDEEIGCNWTDRDSLRTYRHLIDTRGDTLPVRTSGYATYGDTKIPSGSGTIDGILYSSRKGVELCPISATRAKFTEPRF